MSISTEQWIVYVAIAIMAGNLGQMLTGRSMGGFVVSTVVGLVGAFLGEYIAHSFGAQEPLAVTISGRTIPVLWPIVGAMAAALVVALFQRRPERARAR